MAVVETKRSKAYNAARSLASRRAAMGCLMYVFGAVLSDADETPIGRASVVLKAELPSLFPGHGFEFLSPQDLTEIGQAEADRLLFRVLASQVRNTDHEVSDLASPELVLEIQDCVNRIVAAAKARSIN